MTVEQNLHFYSRLYGIKNFKDVIDDLVFNLKVDDLMKKVMDHFQLAKKQKSIYAKH